MEYFPTLAHGCLGHREVPVALAWEGRTLGDMGVPRLWREAIAAVLTHLLCLVIL